MYGDERGVMGGQHIGAGKGSYQVQFESRKGCLSTDSICCNHKSHPKSTRTVPAQPEW